MEKINVIRKLGEGKGNVFQIFGKQVELYWAANKISELSELVSEIDNALKRKDTVKFSKLLSMPTREIIVLRIANVVFHNDYSEFLKHICETLYNSGRKLHITNLLNILRCGLYDDTVGDKVTKTFYKMETKDVISECLTLFKEDIKEQLRDALRKDDRTVVWQINKAFSDIEFYNLLLAYKTDFEQYLEKCAEEFINKREVISWLRLINYTFSGSMKIYEYNQKLGRLIGKNNLFIKVSERIYQRQLNECRMWKYKFVNDVWTVYYKEIQAIKSITFDFIVFNGTIKNEVKRYIEYLLGSQESLYKIRARLSDIRRGISELQNMEYQNIESFLDVNYFHVKHLFNHLQTLKNEDNTRKYELSTVRTAFTEMKLFFEWLIVDEDSENNPFRKISFHNISSYGESRRYIPEEVIEALQDKLGELSPHIQNAWSIMMHTGMRISEVLGLEEDCMYFDPRHNMTVLRYIPFKLENKRKMRGLDKYHIIPIKKIVEQHIQEQIEHTEDLRLIAYTKRIFITKTLYGVTQPNPANMAEHINELLIKYQIKDVSGEIYHYSHHQCRKTVAVELLTKGASIEQIADYLAHLSPRTTNKYYKDIKLKKLADLEERFFKVMFESAVEPEIRNAFTSEERKALYKEILLGTRETPEGHGYCVKHVSFGPCLKKSCVGCKMLTTGPQKLPMWYKLYKEQKEYILQLEDYYKKENIEDYENYREYQAQKRLLTIYEDTINKTEQIAKKVGVPIEREKYLNS